MTYRMILAMFLTATIGGCTERDEQSLAEGGLEVSVAAGYNDPHVVAVELSRFEPITELVSDTSNCVTLRDSTKFTANGVAGTLVEVGGLEFSADSCTRARFEVSFDQIPATIDFVLDDGSARLELSISKDSKQEYQVTRCDFDECWAY
ncbi:MAG: hypothetical protein IPQ07_26385 [Myxococcales bacterium]|nr:hypothetical protein [Myxococcales bacterium]